MTTKEFQIKSGNEILSCSVDYCNENKKPDIISLHGAGPSDKESIKYLSAFLQLNSRSVIRFDFSGQGKSTGNIKHSSLNKRLNEAKSVLNYFGINKNLTIIGTSMGGYIASLLSGFYETDNLILFCPAAYSKEAKDIRFDSGFTEILRTKNSFMNTDIKETLKKFKGKALLFVGSDDEIIPIDVIEIYKNGLSNSSYFGLIEVPGCPHSIHKWMEKNPAIQENIKKTVKNLLNIKLC
jgi:uncharacterized protein